MGQTKLDDYLRVIELCRDVETSSANPFDVDIREKILLLKQRLPELKLLTSCWSTRRPCSSSHR